MDIYRILAINPGSTSVKIAVFENEKPLFIENIKHSSNAPDKSGDIQKQAYALRALIKSRLDEEKIELSTIDAFAGRGGGLVPCASGVYEVNKKMLEDVQNNPLIHPSKYGPQTAYDFAAEYGKKAYVVNSPHSDEYEDCARILGIDGLERLPHIHTLNQKETAIRTAEKMNRKYEECNFVVAHLGGGASVTAHKNGRMVDSTDCISGDGPMAPTRTGQIDAIYIIDMCFSGKYTKDEMYRLLMTEGGLKSLLGTSDGLEIEEIRKHNAYACLVYDAMIHQILKSIGAMAAVLEGKVDAVILTGGLAKDKYLVDKLTAKSKYIAPMYVYPGEFEMEALSNGALRVIKGTEPTLEYTGIPAWPGIKAYKNARKYSDIILK